MSTTNPDRLGEYSKFYYIKGDTNIIDGDAAVLGQAWNYLCVVDVSMTRARTLREVVDRCVGDDKEYTGGKRDTGVAVNINELRLTAAMIREWHEISDTSSIIAILILNSDITDPLAWGMAMNALVEQDDDNQPSEGNNVNSLSFKPAARSIYTPKVVRVYGSGVA